MVLVPSILIFPLEWTSKERIFKFFLFVLLSLSPAHCPTPPPVPTQQLQPENAIGGWAGKGMI